MNRHAEGGDDRPETLLAVRRLLSEGVGAPSVRDAAEVLARVSRDTLGAEHAVAYLADEQDRIGQVVPVGVPDEYVERIHDLLVGEDGDRIALWGASRRDDHPVVTVDDTTDSGLIPGDVVASLALRAYLAFPVLGADDEVLGGVVCSHAARTRSWRPRDRRVARQLAAEGSLIVENASLRETERRQLAQLTRQALHDPLTGLSNRTVLFDRLEHALAASQRSGGTLGLIFVDVDRFKHINDTRGHDAGDRVLSAVAACLRECVREADTLARFAGDEFVVLLEGTTAARTRTAADRLAERLRPLEVGLRDGSGSAPPGRGAGAPASVEVTASLGVATIAGGTIDAEGLLRRADQAMYRAKRRGRSPAVYRPDRDRSPLEQDRVHGQLRDAIHDGGLELRFQPVVHLRSGSLLGLEALVRWDHPEQGLLPPAEFLPLAEETGLIAPLGRWVLATACRHLARWQADHPDHAPLRLAVNISPRQLARGGQLVEDVTDAVRAAGIDPDHLVAEITETALLPAGVGREQLEALRAAGLRTALDDFGVGYSSLRHLQQLPVHVLKIDRTFVAGLDGADGSDGGAGSVAPLISAIRTLGEAFHLDVVAEGVETAAQRRELLSLGIGFAQGHLCSPPLTPARVDRLLAGATAGPFGHRARVEPTAG